MVNKFDRKDSRILLFCDLILYLHELTGSYTRNHLRIWWSIEMYLCRF